MEQDLDQAERARRRRVLFLTVLLMIGLPLYIFAASWLAAAINPVVIDEDGALRRALPWYVEILVYLALGLVWALPFRRLSKGLARPVGGRGR